MSSTHTLANAEALAVKRAARRRSVSVEVEVSEYVTVDVPFSKIATDELVAELRARGGEQVRSDGELDDDEALFPLRPAELERIRHLFLIGREVEAAARCRTLIADLLGTAL